MISFCELIIWNKILQPTLYVTSACVDMPMWVDSISIFYRMMDHIQKYEANDPFVAGIAQHDNPFKDQKGCLIL